MSSNDFPKEEVAGISVVALLVALFANHFVAFVESKATFEAGLTFASKHLADLGTGVWFSTSSMALPITLVAFVAVFYAYYAWKSKGTFRRGEEHGSARFATKREMDAFADLDVPIDNTIMGEGVELAYEPAKTDHEHARHRNVLIIGGTGSGKTRGYVKPNLMQIPAEENSGRGSKAVPVAEQERWARSFFVTDPKGTTRVETGHLFASHGYKVKEFNTIDFSVSDHYNPIAYIHDDVDVVRFAHCLIANTTPPDAGKGGDPFWEKSESMLYQALINYILTEVPPEERNLVTMFKMLDMAKSTPKGQMNGLDILFAELETGKQYVPEEEEQGVSDDLDMKSNTHAAPNPWKDTGREPQPYHPAVVAYNGFRSAAEETFSSIIVSCHARLAPMRSAKVQEVLKDDDMELNMFGDQKMVCYAVVSANDPTYNFMLALLMWQMLDELMRRGTMVYGKQNGHLPVGVDFIMDEAANFYVPNLEKTIAVVRSYNIGLTLILQSKAQLKARYQDDADTIVDNCPTLVFLGGKSKETNKELEEMMGQQTVSTDNQSKSHAEKFSWSEQLAQHGRALMQSSEISKMSNSKELVFIQGANPWIGPKTDVTKHPMYKYIDPGHKGAVYKRGFDFAAYKEDREYFEKGDADLLVTTRTQLYTSLPFNTSPAQTRAYTVKKTVVIRNMGDVEAFNLNGYLELKPVLESNRDKKVFPAAEPFGTEKGLPYYRYETGSNHATVRKEGPTTIHEDVIEWVPANHQYHLSTVHLKPGAKLVLRMSVSIPVSDVLATFKAYEEEHADFNLGGDVDSPDLLVSFGFRTNIDCANHDPIELDETHVLDVNDFGYAELEEVVKPVEPEEAEANEKAPAKGRKSVLKGKRGKK